MRTLLASMLLLWSATASAQEVRLTVPLDWRHLPRVQHELDVLMETHVPLARIVFQRWESGKQAFNIDLIDGHSCATMTSRNYQLTLKCGNANGFYWLTKAPGKSAKLEWVTIASILPDTQE